MHLLKTAIQVLKTTLKFIWRHAFVFASFSFLISLIMDGWNVHFYGIVKLFFMAALIDWIKMKIKFVAHRDQQRSTDCDRPLHVRDYWNSTIVGSPSYLSSIGTSSQYY